MDKPIAAKSVAIPGYATQEDLIGYTCDRELKGPVVDVLIKRAKDLPSKPTQDVVGNLYWHDGLLLPTVYYKKGHATLQHPHKDKGPTQKPRFSNVGWTESKHWTWLFFGNVRKSYADLLEQKRHVIEKKAFLANLHMDLPENWSYITSRPWSDHFDKKVNKLWGNLTSPTANLVDCSLYELWFQGEHVKGHVSRNIFRWVDRSTPLAEALHALATTPGTGNQTKLMAYTRTHGAPGY